MLVYLNENNYFFNNIFLSAVVGRARTWTAINGKEVAAEFVSNEKELLNLS